ncbi:MAG: DUF192 domain-containing protein [Rubrivivax sp.]|nr:MAG: DUF192 domain-containing protein [Rubrivivax sp.]
MTALLKKIIEPAAFAWVAAVLIALPAQAQDHAQQLPTVMLGASFHNIKAEVALTEKEHEIGLMHRTSMGPNDGMIFVFDRPGQQCFWMKNTLIPLAIAFIADDGTIVNLDEMKPETLNPHCSAKPVRFVLEMNTGWFSKRGLKPGLKMTGAPFEKPASAK